MSLMRVIFFLCTALGLGHSTDKNAVMYLMYQGFKSNKLQLHSDDIAAIQVLVLYSCEKRKGFYDDK